MTDIELCRKFGHHWVMNEEDDNRILLDYYCDVCGVHKWWYHALSEEE